MTAATVEIGSRVRVRDTVMAPHLRRWIGWKGVVRDVAITPIGFLAVVQPFGFSQTLRLFLTELEEVSRDA